jgi:hypothetical protein
MDAPKAGTTLAEASDAVFTGVPLDHLMKRAALAGVVYAARCPREAIEHFLGDSQDMRVEADVVKPPEELITGSPHDYGELRVVRVRCRTRWPRSSVPVSCIEHPRSVVLFTICENKVKYAVLGMTRSSGCAPRKASGKSGRLQARATSLVTALPAHQHVGTTTGWRPGVDNLGGQH